MINLITNYLKKISKLKKNKIVMAHGVLMYFIMVI